MKRESKDFQKKYTYDELLRIAKEKGGEIITTPQEYRELIKHRPPSRALYKWWCGNQEHEYFEMSPKSINEGRWCKKCDIERGKDLRYKYNYNRLLEMAIERGGELITTSEEYNELIKRKRPMDVIVKWWCNNPEHEPINRAPREINAGRWCEDCIEKRRRKKIRIAKITYTYNKLIEVAKKNDGLLITNEEEYENLIKDKKPSEVYFEWWCKKRDHEYFKATPNNIREGSWCPECFRERQKAWQISRIGYTFEYLAEEADKRGGFLITTSKEFQKLIKNIRPSRTLLTWWCGDETHEYWIARPHDIIIGNKWCPECAEGKYERILRATFREIFKKKFSKTPLKNVIELIDKKIHDQYGDILANLLKFGHYDGFDIIEIKGNTIKIAFEYNGPQHYEYPNPYHSTKALFNQQVRRDELKRLLSLNNNIILIEFPHFICPRMNKTSIIQDSIKEEFYKKTQYRI